jgi:hypothetical protein
MTQMLHCAEWEETIISILGSIEYATLRRLKKTTRLPGIE